MTTFDWKKYKVGEKQTRDNRHIWIKTHVLSDVPRNVKTLTQTRAGK